VASLDRVPPPNEFLFLSREAGNKPIDRRQAHRMLKGLCRVQRLISWRKRLLRQTPDNGIMRIDVFFEAYHRYS
jgi:hypothetical protein